MTLYNVGIRGRETTTTLRYPSMYPNKNQRRTGIPSRSRRLCLCKSPGHWEQQSPKPEPAQLPHWLSVLTGRPSRRMTPSRDRTSRESKLLRRRDAFEILFPLITVSLVATWADRAVRTSRSNENFGLPGVVVEVSRPLQTGVFDFHGLVGESASTPNF